jgi:hypothetical protein
MRNNVEQKDLVPMLSGTKSRRNVHLPRHREPEQRLPQILVIRTVQRRSVIVWFLFDAA